MWILTRTSLCYVADASRPSEITFIKYPPENLPVIFRALTEDSQGNIWITTDTGLLSLNSNTGELSGYHSDSFSGFSAFSDRAAASMSDGSVVIASLDGAWSFKPENLYAPLSMSKVAILDCASIYPENFNNLIMLPVEPTGEVRTDYDKSSLRISFGVPDISQSEIVEYSVMLEGMDSEWSAPMKQTSVVYRNLPPGDYTFKVRARMPNQKWTDENTAALRLSVAPPFWDTWYARLFYIIAAVALVWLWLRRYSRRLNRKGTMEVERTKEIQEQKLNDERLRFYTNITHELRTPLTLILGPLEDLITDDSLEEPNRKKVKLIHESAIRLLNLVNQLLEFRKTETHNRRLCVTRGNLGDYVTEIALRFRELNRNPKVTINIDAAGKAKGIYFDQDIVNIVLTNLLSNALKYTPEGSVNVSLREYEKGGAKYAEIIVADTGYGIEPDALPRIFERYYKVAGNHQASGTGIGLALVKALADVHGAELKVESTPGKGTVFHVVLMADCAYPEALHTDGEEVSIEPAEPSEEENNGDNRPAVLVVEDNYDIRKYIANSLSAEYRIYEGADGREGLSMALHYNPDIIISDIMMPVLDGLGMLRELKADVRTSHIPVVLLTAKDTLQDKQVGYDAGADSYLTKPFSARLLRSRIHNILKARASLTGSLTMKAATPGGKSQEAKAAVAAQENEQRLDKFDRMFLDKFTTLVEENITRPELDMKFLQDKMNMSHSTLYRKIKGIMGISGNEFIRKVKLRHAMNMLLDGSGVSEAAYGSGFNDTAYFRACFKEEYGESPSTFIRRSSSAD